MHSDLRTSLLVAVAATLSVIPSASDGQTAAEIVEMSGVQGGLVVHIGCGDGKLTAKLHKSDSFVVLGLDTDPANVKAAREHIKSKGLYGKVTIDVFDGKTLPLIDNVVNMIVVSGFGSRGSGAEMTRALAPRGVLLTQESSLTPDTRHLTPHQSAAPKGWYAYQKPVSPQIDEWSHYLHGPDGNAVSSDKLVSYPTHMQWAGHPLWTRNHNHLNSYSAVVTSGGRVFYILDEGPIQSIKYPAKWRLAARDAYNGVVLWKEDIPKWEDHLRRFRSGPVEIQRRLVASHNRVYVTLGYNEPVSILDAATGKLLHTVNGSKGAHEIMLSDGLLYLVAGTYEDAKVDDKRIIVASAEDGKKIREISTDDVRKMMPATLCMDQEALYFQSQDSLVCLSKETGKAIWKSPRPIELNRLAWSAPSLVVHGDVVLCADGTFTGGADKKTSKGKGKSKPKDSTPSPMKPAWRVSSGPGSQEGELIAFSAKDGKELWRCPAALGYSSPANLFVIDGLVWVSELPGINEQDVTRGRDLHTGEVKRTLKTARAFEAAHHHRCYRDKATDRFFLFGRTGVEYVDIHNNDIQRHFWIRGSCQYGLMPANGLLYLPGHSCGCYIQSKLNGFWALASKRPEVTDQESRIRRQESGVRRLHKGVAYGSIQDSGLRTQDSSWPTHRHDPARSGCTKTAVPKDLTELWTADLAGDLTSPVIANGMVVVAAKDQHTAHAIDAKSGKQLWFFTAGGTIDSPPTIHGQSVVFGSHDGYTYCLRASDGALAWKYLAAPQDKRTIAFGQLESVWPVVGSVSVVNGTVYCVAGRSSYIDGGMVIRRLDLATGKEIGSTPLYSRDTETGEQPDELLEDVELPGSLPDILVFEGDSMFLRDRQFDLKGKEKVGQYSHHLYSSGGLLDPHWWHRTIWIWGTRAWGRASGWAIAGRHNPSGRMLVLDGPLVYGYKFSEWDGNNTLFCADKKVEKVNRKLSNNNAAIVKYVTPDKVVYHWQQRIEIAVRGMVKAGDTIFLAGPKDAQEIFDDKAESVLAAFDAKQGETLSQMTIPCPPVFDGMAAADERLFISLTNGKVSCYGKK